MSLSRDEVLLRFREAGLSPGARVEVGRLHDQLSACAGYPFDKELFEELVSQCNRVGNQVEVNEFSGFAVEAYQILLSRIREDEANVLSLEKAIVQAEKDHTQGPKAEALRNNYQDAVNDLNSYKREKVLLDSTFRR
jgi:hypothetical protein